MWPAALAAGPVQRALAGRSELRQETLRLWGTLESQLAATLRQYEFPRLEVTTCLRDGELEIVTRYGPDAQQEHDRLVEVVREAHGPQLFSTGPTVDDLVASAFADRGLTVATTFMCATSMAGSGSAWAATARALNAAMSNNIRRLRCRVLVKR